MKTPEEDMPRNTPPGDYRDIYYEQPAVLSEGSSDAEDVLSGDEQTLNSEAFVTEQEQQYAYLVEKYPRQADIYIGNAYKIHEHHPKMMSSLAIRGLLALKKTD
jgi:hypothetical protein